MPEQITTPAARMADEIRLDEPFGCGSTTPAHLSTAGHVLHVETDGGDDYALTTLPGGVAIGLAGGYTYGLLTLSQLRQLIDHLIAAENVLSAARCAQPPPRRASALRVTALAVHSGAR